MEKQRTIAFLGQPNTGKSTLFNGLTGSRQHVGNWPGKTVEQKEGYFSCGGVSYTLVDLPGTYGLSAHSEEEIVTRDYIASGKADTVCILADASQLERSLFMLADYAGIHVPVFVVFNMMDIAAGQSKQIDHPALADELGVPIVPLVAADTKKYDAFYAALEQMEQGNACELNLQGLMACYEEVIGENYRKILHLLPEKGVGVYTRSWLAAKLIEKDPLALETVRSAVPAENWIQIEKAVHSIVDGNVLTGDCKFQWIENLLKDHVVYPEKRKEMGRFDKLATSKTWGNPLAIALILAGLVLSIIIAMPFMGIFSYIPMMSGPIAKALTGIGIPVILVSLLCDAVLAAVSFALLMSSFVFGVSLVFGFMEEVGYMARIAYVFDNTMSKLGLQGKAVMPFLVSFGCNIGGVAGTRVIDSWGQRVTTMALSWVVPCASTWGVVGLISTVFFKSKAILVIVSMFLIAFLHILITSKIFGKQLMGDSGRTGLIMELPPYHRPRYKNLFKFVFNRMGDVFRRALKIIIFVSVVFWALSYTPDGKIEHSLIYQIGVAIEPVTMIFGLRWQLFMAWLTSAMGKESSLGVLSALFNAQGIWTAIADQKIIAPDTAAVGGSLLSTISKPEALAFVYAFFFNMPCLMTLSATVQESHSVKWALRIAGYYMFTSLILAALVYRIGLIIF
ncbi:small GTP-binding protein [Syntrophobotulus glycolicus DSM 8271]|uniref:Ferrous iron transport protein B n=1 Tax=Syntrophobotulus glycolicus (strain DSM 8271 / FlGlyR) TaxID=645991 RepID=F0SUN7_SYNGF|nr:ferrous iron transport protein B [Syntrophobotulus glycolicus]ADY55530.1 small GTP-binding protein [Syntrophobotulus glycolicus DSM 8271]